MKYLYALAISAFLSTSAFAQCNPAIGNWVNAAKITCDVSDKKHGENFIVTEKGRHNTCEHEK